MKKCIGLICAIIAVVMLASCNSRTALQEFTGATSKQIRVVEKILSDSNITYEKVSVSANPLTEGMDTDWKAFDFEGILRTCKSLNSLDL